MKKIIILLAVLTALIAGVARKQAFAQERTPVKVKGSVVVTGVVIVDILKNGKPMQLQCNEGAGKCTTLKSGSYAMVELPENEGLYDCKNVEIYREDKEKPEEAELLGRYCLVGK
jgi:hypothetical protein